MKKEDLCPGDNQAVWEHLGYSPRLNRTLDGFGQPTEATYALVKRKRLTCSTCGRRVTSRIRITHDADDAVHSLPPHKRKGWWKKHTRRPERAATVRGRKGAHR